ncbi:MAG TPA: cyclase family protein [Pyrinomonadaceae bacterium]
MIQTFRTHDGSYEFDPSKPIDISIPLQFNGPQPNAYGVAPATSVACAAGELVGDTRRGGSCNFEQYTLIPHCNGTHTECVGHITHERLSIRDCLQDALSLVLMVTVIPEKATEANETYSVPIRADDFLITRNAIERALRFPTSFSALVVRTDPNDLAKSVNKYDETNVPPYFTNDAMQYIVDRGVKHLLVDIPSVDRLYDEGRLSNHRIFWNIEEGSFEMNTNTRRGATITELIYVPDDVGDGVYLLNLQIAPFASDASPSRPVLFRLTEN